MKIEIAERFRPFSHEVGESLLLPGSSLKVQIFPRLIRVLDVSTFSVQEVVNFSLPLEDVEQFTVQQDLEKGKISVWGQEKEGFFRYHLYATLEGGVLLEPEKGRIPSLGSGSKYTIPPLSRLFLGCTKSQDWMLIRRRKDLKEIFPIWHRLGQLITPSNLPSQEETLLERCRTLVNQRSAQEVLRCFRRLFEAGLESGFSPRLNREELSAICREPLSSAPLQLLTEGSRLIQSLFFRLEPQHLFLLPLLPHQFSCGRFTRVELAGLGVLAFEWSKGDLRRVEFVPSRDQELSFSFCREVNRCRLTEDRVENQYHSGNPLSLKADCLYLFDRFES